MFYSEKYVFITVINAVSEDCLGDIAKRVERFCQGHEPFDESRISKDGIYEIEPGIRVIVLKKVPLHVVYQKKVQKTAKSKNSACLYSE